MTTLFPGATWVPVPGQEKRALRRKGRGVGYHVAVFEGPSIEKIDEGTGNDSHLYVRFDGSVEQNVDLDRVSYAMVAGNATMITVETEGGVAHPEHGITADNQPWTPAQVATLARIARWAHDTEGVPLQLMPNSLPASKGLAPHRWGIAPWRVAGGEVWSSANGKVCPGTAKIAQLPQILAAALAGGTTDPSEEDDMPQLGAGCVQPGDNLIQPLPPVGAPGKPAGIAGWGAAWLTVRADGFGTLTGPCTARIAVQHGDGTWRPLSTAMDVTLEPGSLGVTVQLQPGDVGFVITPTGNYPVGWCVEYARA